MGSFSSPNETRQRSYVSMEEIYKRKQQRSRGKDGQEKGGVKSKFRQLKLVLFIIVGATFISLLYSPYICSHDHSFTASTHDRPNMIRKWMWGGEDPRYKPHFQINWDDISKALDLLPEKHYHSTGLLNFDHNEISQWTHMIPDIQHTILHLPYAPHNLTWDTLYPEWIDEEEESDVPSCPALPQLQHPGRRLDMIVVKLPCARAQGKRENWSRDVARLHLQLAAAGLAASAKGEYPVHVLFVTECFPVPNLFTCKELVKREGNVWLYRPDLDVLRDKVKLPVGSCELALPLKFQERAYKGNPRREAYATILHSAQDYVCGAIAAAQSIRMSGSNRDLVILVDDTISPYHRSGLEAAGWHVRLIQRIRNPNAEKDAYNEWNYSKFRLWQLTDYDKIIFIDADLLVLRNLDSLFSLPEISATGNNATLFNSGVMVIEPSNCTFNLLMSHIHEIESYNGGDQGYLNEIFTWWHRVPRRMNFLKHFWVGDDEEKKVEKTLLFGAEPPVLYVLHYLGIKPWLCYRDYDCNWNVDFQQEFASDVAHARWWNVHDAMPEVLQQFCLLPSKQKAQIEWDRRQAEKGDYRDGHWRIEVKDERMKKCIDKLCNWKSMLRHWGESNWTNDRLSTPSPPAIKLP